MCATRSEPDYDMRDQVVAKRPKIKLRRGEPVVRKPEDIDGICLHQTACDFGIASYQLRAAGGDYNLALAHRARDTVKAHAVAFEEGFFVASAPLLWHVNGANGLNPHVLNLEIEGKFPGLRTSTPHQIEYIIDTMSRHDVVFAARRALEWLVEEGRSLGCPIEYVYAHRQSNKNRRGDPGEQLWDCVVEQFAIPNLGLKPRYDFTVGSGRPIPGEWCDGKTSHPY